MSDKLTTPTNQLKPCPFCGAVYKKREWYWIINHYSDCFLYPGISIRTKNYVRIDQWQSRKEQA